MKKYIWIALISFFLGIFAAGYIFVYLPEKSTPKINLPEKTSTSFTPSLYASAAPEVRTDLDFVEISERVAQAVVKIESEIVEKRRVLGFGDEWPFEDWCDRFFGRPERREQEYKTIGTGTGFYISSDGYIVTNNHVVERAVKITVYSIEGEEYPAEVVGTDSRTDLALLKIKKDSLPFVELGDSAQVKVGEWVLAIGNPWGLEHTVTAGIVSAKGRQLGLGGQVPTYQDFIQTDAAINRGNSGGPLVNLKGEVIGITSNIYSPTGGNIGIGFAIPSNIAKRVIAQLKEKGRVVRGYLGIVPGAVSEDLRKLLKLEKKKGALVNSVEAGTPADKAGLKQYDVIIEVNGQEIKDDNDLRFKIADIKPGTKVDIKIIRDGKEKMLTATIEEMPSTEEAEESVESPSSNLGLTVTPMTPNLARRYGYRTEDGLLVTRVEPYSEAARKGMDAGDIILEVNRKKVNSTRELERMLKETKSGEAILLLVRRESDGEFIDRIITLRIP